MSVQGLDVTIETSLGAFTVELYWDHAPKVRKSGCKSTTTKATADVQELCGASQERLLQWRHLSSDHSSMYNVVLPLVTRLTRRWVRLQDFMIQVRLPISIGNAYFHNPSIGWRPYWNGQRWNEYLRSKIVRPSPTPDVKASIELPLP